MTKIITKNNLTKDYVAEQVNALSSTQAQVFAEIIQGLYQGKPLLGTGGLLTNLIKDLTQIALSAELDAHLEKDQSEYIQNRKNGTSIKTVKTNSGSNCKLLEIVMVVLNHNWSKKGKL